MKKLLDKYDDDFYLSFGDYEFQPLVKKHGSEVEVKLTPISDYEVRFEDVEKKFTIH